ncbi:MAG: Tim44/TimA family putative adaptor protein [Pseudomonadota bacterium]|nr:Tim44/TimA family putative adaptor protein [Pseudomonadota bacterium]
MNETFDIYTLLFLVLAVAIFLRLRSVLGRRTGNERQPFDPYTRAPETKGKQPSTADTRGSVVRLPRGEGQGGLQTAEMDARIKDFAPKGSALAKGLKAIMSNDASFDPNEFLKGAKAAYEMIVVAFASGDRRALKQLLNKDVYDGFVGAMDERETRGELVESSFVGIDRADIIEAEMKSRSAQVTVKFVSDLITSTRDKDGKVIDGDPKKVREVTDIWTFARDVTSRYHNWKLVATEAAN